MTWRQETTAQNQNNSKRSKEVLKNEIYKIKSKYTYTMPPKIFGHLINTSKTYEFYYIP